MDIKSVAKEARQFVVFRVGDQEFGADIHKVSIIEKPMPAARVPTTPAYIKGVINLRGEIIPIMSLRMKFDMPEIPEDDDTRIIIFKFYEMTLGIMVDRVDEVVTLKDSDVESVTSITNDRSLDYILGIAKIDGRIVTLLNIEKLISDIVAKD